MRNYIKFFILYSIVLSLIIWVITTFALNFPANVPAWELNQSWSIINYLSKMLVNPNLSTTDWKVKKSSTLINQDCWNWKILQWFDINWNKICVNLWTFTYSRDISSWGSCSADCDWWIQTRTVKCKRSDWLIVIDTFCTAPKPITSSECNTQACCTWQCLWTDAGVWWCVRPWDFYYWYWAPCDCWCY